MFDWLQKLSKKEPETLAGQPAQRRVKTHTAESGYVYEYYYEGYRVSVDDGATGAEHVFQVSADRKEWTPVSVFLPDASVAWWEEANSRTLNATERYAIVKLALFSAFDERDNPALMSTRARVREADIDAIVKELGLESDAGETS